MKSVRPKTVKSCTYHKICGCGDLFVTCTDKQKELFEVFVTLGKAGGCGQANKASIGKLISVALRSGTSPKDIVKVIEGVSCHKANHVLGIPTCIDAVSQAIKEHEDTKSEANILSPKA